MPSDSKIANIVNYIQKFLVERSSSSGALWVRACETVYLAIKDFIQDRCLLRASALTYTTLLSLVPLLALMFAVLKGFGVQNSIAPMILERLAAGSDSVVEAILLYINNTKVGRLGAFGLVALLMTVLALISNIEDAFNHVWRVKETRSLSRRFADYFSLIMVAPIFMFAAISMTSSANSNLVLNKLVSMAFVGKIIFLLLKLAPFLVMWLVFILLYLLIPNVKVKVGAALIGGICGGTLWQFAQLGYVNFQFGVAKYNAIYGTMAALPIFMIWIYVSWLIVLFGLEISYVCQNRQSIHGELMSSDMGYADYEFHAVNVLCHIAKRFNSANSVLLSTVELSELAKLPMRNLQSLLSDLVQKGYLRVAEQSGEEIRYLPAYAPAQMNLVELFVSLRQNGSVSNVGVETTDKIAAMFTARLEAEKKSLKSLTVQDLIEG